MTVPPSRAELLALPEWIRRQLHIWWEDDHPSCWCTFEDTEEFAEAVFHPTPGCPLRTDCGGWSWDPPCGGCDRCIIDQIMYYRMKDREASAAG